MSAWSGLNPMLFPLAAAGAALFAAGFAAGRRGRAVRLLALVGGLALAVPGLLFAAYYLHLFDDWAWFYQMRSVRGTELLGAGLGFPAGLVFALTLARRRGTPLPALLRLAAGTAIILLLAVILFLPYAKQILTPLAPGGIGHQWSDGVCRQTAPSTCGPCSAATILAQAGITATEKELALESHTTLTGTENWYLARALRRRGLGVRFVTGPGSSRELPHPSIAGVRLGPGGPGHFVAVLDKTDDGYVIADSLKGRFLVADPASDPRFVFTGFFMVVE